jgi:hypothetical protein
MNNRLPPRPSTPRDLNEDSGMLSFITSTKERTCTCVEAKFCFGSAEKTGLGRDELRLDFEQFAAVGRSWMVPFTQVELPHRLGHFG